MVKVFGRNLKTDEQTANRIADILNQVRGITDVFVFRSLGQPNIVVTPDRQAAARYGLNSGDVSAIVQAAIGGQTVTQVLEGDRSFGLVVRWKPDYREDLVAMRNIRVNVPTGGNVPLGPNRPRRDHRGGFVHLPRRSAALRAGAFFGGRTRSAEHSCGSKAAGRPIGGDARGYTYRMGR